LVINLRSENNAVATARAFATYALVPYLGILFCPGALLLGVGVVKSYRFPETAGGDSRRIGMVWMFVASIELAAQLTLWWLLYKVPEWSQSL
jgi:hypothetical protein